ncbi:MAG: nitroreductase [Bergeyella zoohelcum]|nr:nitroreductase [Bergeyella zoohelcum]
MVKQQILKEIIESRKSIFPKDYTGKAIADEVLAEILASADFAPNHKRTKPWRLNILKGEKKDALGKELQNIYKKTSSPDTFLQKKYDDIGAKVSKTTAVVPIVIDFSGLVPEWEEVAAVAMAVQNMYLTATVHNVGCYWSSPPLVAHLGEFLGLEENQKCFGIFYLGSLD